MKQILTVRRRAVLGVTAFLLVVCCATGARAKTYTLQSTSMEPTLHAGDSVTFGSAERCCKRRDIVVFDTAVAGWANAAPNDVKRIIALPGETIEPCGAESATGKVCIDKTQLREPYLASKTRTTFRSTSAVGCAPESPPAGCTVLDGFYFVMGDNRDRSSDSRFRSPIPKSSITGIYKR